MKDKIKLRLAESEDFSLEVIADLEEKYDLLVAPCLQSDLKQIFEEFDIFWFRLGFTITAELFSEKTKCKIIATPVTGIDHIDEKACAKYGVKIICLRGETEFLKEVRATAEMTIALTLTLLRNMYPAMQDVLAGNWRRDLFRGNEIYKKTVGIVGLGRLGCIVAEYFKVIGAKVIGYDIHRDFPEGVIAKNTLEALFEEADIISLHVRYDESTHHLIDKKLLERGSDKKILVNTSRGGIVNEADLLEALESKKIAGAALDVIQKERFFDSSNDLYTYAKTHHNLVLVPHIAGNTYESFEKTEKFIAFQIYEEVEKWQS